MIYPVCLALVTFFTAAAVSANADFLPADQAFKLSAESLTEQDVKVSWEIAPHYYLYHQQFKVINQGTPLTLALPQGQMKDDPTFGRTEVHYNQVTFNFKVKPENRYKVIWQGCSQDGLCYPLQTQWIETDQDGLIPQSLNGRDQQTLTSLSQKTHPFTTTSQPTTNQTSSESESNNTSTPSTSTSSEKIVNDIESNAETTSSLQSTNDQSFLNLLSHHGLFLNLLIFFGLGVLLAFLPCSLPLIPILSSLIIQRQSGYRAVVIASCFVLSMALVYGLMGMFVAEIGFSFQQWFQSPWFISSFALLFVIFALNLFGLFQFSLPQAWTNKLDQLSAKQKSGTLLGSILLGALSALIVGPCMSAPLAGALLFVSQSRDLWMGGLYLFVMGLGIGFPLFIACVFGSKLLPKPGVWMNHIKICFGFLMLIMAVYFIRPLMDSMWYAISLAVILFGLGAYLMMVIRHQRLIRYKLLLVLLSIGSFYGTYYFAMHAIKDRKLQLQKTNLIQWHTVSTAEQFEQALKQAQSQQLPVVVDVYADWCVACQPIEKDIIPSADVQQVLQGIVLIKLDLSQQHESHHTLLKRFEILGPPTILFIDPQGRERRQLRITGSFKADQLVRTLNHLKSQ